MSYSSVHSLVATAPARHDGYLTENNTFSNLNIADSTLEKTKKIIDNLLIKHQITTPIPSSETTTELKEVFPLSNVSIVQKIYNQFNSNDCGELSKFFIHFLTLHDGCLYDPKDLQSFPVKEKRMLLVHGILQCDALNEFQLITKIQRHLNTTNPTLEAELTAIIDDMRPIRICHPINFDKKKIEPLMELDKTNPSDVLAFFPQFESIKNKLNDNQKNTLDRLIKLIEKYLSIESTTDFNINIKENIQKEVNLILNCGEPELQCKSFMFHETHKNIFIKTAGLLDQLPDFSEPLSAVFQYVQQPCDRSIGDYLNQEIDGNTLNLIKKFINSGVKSLDEQWLTKDRNLKDNKFKREQDKVIDLIDKVSRLKKQSQTHKNRTIDNVYQEFSQIELMLEKNK